MYVLRETKIFTMHGVLNDLHGGSFKYLYTFMFLSLSLHKEILSHTILSQFTYHYLCLMEKSKGNAMLVEVIRIHNMFF